MAGFAEGRIKKIKLRNFMTYDHVELYPKKGLNLIVGLNGSGKSSIMCAISLGLAGKPHFTGRATQLSDFVKHGCQEAEIEIELEKAKGSLLIRRKIKGDKCEWILNHSVSNQSEVANAVKQCNIDTSNLCQFLPQEKVMKFSSMDKKQRLENMLQTIGEPHLFELFNELKDLNREFEDIQQELKRSQAKKSSAEEENKRISSEVQKQESRVRLRKELDEMLVRRKVVNYLSIRDEVETLKKKYKTIETELAAARDEEAKAVTFETTILKSYRQYFNQKEKFNSEKNNVISKITNASNALRTLKEKAENADIEYRNRLIEIEDEKNRWHDLNRQVEGLKQHLSDGNRQLQKSNEQYEVDSEAHSQLQQELNSLYERIQALSAEKNQIAYSIERNQRELCSLQNEHNKKMENLKRCDRFTYDAACWLQENSNTFVSNIYLPIMLEIKVHSTENCKYVESSIPFRDMIAFVCENKNDYQRFTDVVAEKGWPVNVVMPPDNPLTAFTSTPLESQYKNCGLECFVSDLFTAPDPILRYLYSCYRINTIPVAFNPVLGDNVNRILQKYRTFFSGNHRITGKISRYGNRNMSLKKDFILEQQFLTIHNDEQLQVHVERELQILMQKKLSNATQFQELELKSKELEKKQEEIRQRKKLFQELKKRIAKQHESYQQKVNSLEHISRINVEEEKMKITKIIRSINEHRNQTLPELNKSFKEFIHLEKEIIKLILAMNSLSKSLKLTQAANEEVHDKVKATEVEYETARKEHREKKNYGLALLQEIKAAGEEYVKYTRATNVSTFGLDAESTEQRITHIQAQLSIDEDNEPLVAEYNARKLKIEEYQTEINKILARLEEIKEDIEMKKTQWLTPLQRHIENINKKFSHYFKLLKCAGEINLDIPDNQYDFVKYGLQIKLKFRDEEPLVELSQTRHSGGECSVAAIVFILSLQELTQVPFRCIDEINQGMDSVNERNIYQLIADSVGDDRCSQYFLLTPKLLPDLQYPGDVAVHIIFNSCFLNMNLDVKKHLKCRNA